MKIKEIFEYILFTKRCACCKEIIYPYEDVCSTCKRDLKFIENICNTCGNTKAKCECKLRSHLFYGITVPLFNEGSARQGIWHLKFRGKLSAADYFGKLMADCVKRDFGNIDFDFITAVPIKNKTFGKRLNHAELLANKVSEHLSIPTDFSVISKKKHNKTQHELDFRERVKNVNGVYSVNKSLENKNVLLVDDIKTTGATLNECSKQLLLGGAKTVYCVTALITTIDDGNDNF